jgi:hypothetical protein
MDLMSFFNIVFGMGILMPGFMTLTVILCSVCVSTSPFSAMPLVRTMEAIPALGTSACACVERSEYCSDNPLDTARHETRTVARHIFVIKTILLPTATPDFQAGKVAELRPKVN